MAQCHLNKGTYGKKEKLSKEKKRAGHLTFLTNFKEKQPILSDNIQSYFVEY